MTSSRPRGAELDLGPAPRHAPAPRGAGPAERFALRSVWPWVALGALLVAGAVLIAAQTRGNVFADDEWIWILQRRGGGVSTYLDPHNSHLSLVPVAIYKLLFATVGIRHYWPYRAIVTAAHLGVVALLFAYVRPRVGVWMALLAAALLLFFGPGWQDFLWPFQVAWLIALGAGLGALLMLDRRDTVGDVGASLLLAVSLASAGPGLAVAAGLVIEVVLIRPRRRWWTVAAPIALYAVWWLGYQQTNVSHDSIFYITRFVFDAAAGVFSSLAGVTGSNALTNSGDFVSWGAPLLLVAVAAGTWRLRRAGRVPTRVLTLAAMALAFWVLAATGRAYVTLGSAVLTSTGDESRYLYVGALLVLALASEVLRGARMGTLARTVAGVVVLAAVVANIGALRSGAQLLRDQSKQAVAELGALDIARPIVAPSYVSQGFIFGIVKAGPYFQAERALGTPAASPAQIAVEPDAVRAAADRQLIAIHRVTLPALPAAFARGRGPPPVAQLVQSGSVAASGSCLRFTPAAFTPAGAVAELELTVPPTGFVLEAQGSPATVQLRRFATGQAQTIGTLQPGEPVLLRISPDRASVPWHLRLLPGAAASVCSLG